MALKDLVVQASSPQREPAHRRGRGFEGSRRSGPRPTSLLWPQKAVTVTPPRRRGCGRQDAQGQGRGRPGEDLAIATGPRATGKTKQSHLCSGRGGGCCQGEDPAADPGLDPRGPGRQQPAKAQMLAHRGGYGRPGDGPEDGDRSQGAASQTTQLLPWCNGRSAKASECGTAAANDLLRRLVAPPHAALKAAQAKAAADKTAADYGSTAARLAAVACAGRVG